jgi:hypothetical protein
MGSGYGHQGERAIRAMGSDAGDAIALATNVVVPAVTETVQRWSADVGEAVSTATTSAQSLVASGSQSLRRMVIDKQERDEVLLRAATVALTRTLGLPASGALNKSAEKLTPTAKQGRERVRLV